MRHAAPATLAAALILNFLVCHAFITPISTSRKLFFSKSSLEKSLVLFASSVDESGTERDECAQELLSKCRQVGQVGALASQNDREELERLAQKLSVYSDPEPARQPLTGLHMLVYSAANSPASGRIVGSFYGKVTQEFVNDKEYINSVRFGPLQVTARANRNVVDDNTIQVEFQEQAIRLFGKRLVQKQFTASGTWKYLFYGNVRDQDGTAKLLRVMETPSLFVIVKPV